MFEEAAIYTGVPVRIKQDEVHSSHKRGFISDHYLNPKYSATS